MKIEYKNVKSATWYGKKIEFVLDDKHERVFVQECEKCFGNGNIIKPELEHLDEMEWDFEECPECEGEMYVEKKDNK